MNEKMIRRYIAGIFLMTLFNIPMRLAASGLIVDLSLNSGGLFYPKSILFESTDGVQSFTSGMLSNQMDLSIWKEGYPLTVTLSGGYSFVPFLPKSDYKILNSPTIRNLDILIGLNSAWRQVSVNVSAGYSYVSQLYKVEWSPYSESFSKNNFAPALAVSIHPDTDTNYSLGFY